MMREKTTSRRRKDNPTALLFLLLLWVPVYGGYYRFSIFLCGAALIPLILYRTYQLDGFCIPIGLEAWYLYGICVCSALTIPFAVSAGMAFTGFLRVVVWILFFLYASTYAIEERQEVLEAVSYEGVILSLFSMIAFFYDRMAGVEDLNGRIDGWFEYANTWALFQLICFIVLILREHRSAWDYPAMAILLFGIYLSGSRGVLLLLFLSISRQNPPTSKRSESGG